MNKNNGMILLQVARSNNDRTENYATSLLAQGKAAAEAAVLGVELFLSFLASATG